MAYTTLTWKEFLEEATDFLNTSQSLDDNWELYKKNEVDGNAFLKCKRKLQLNISKIKETNAKSFEEPSTPVDESALVKPKEEILLFEYHILYSASYQVPMLYLQIQQSDGSIVELEDVWQIFCASDQLFETKTRKEMLTILTQMEHPILFKPYYAIHPCKTAELLAQTPKSENRILTFLSLMGPYVKLNLDNRYGKKKKINK